MKITGHVIETSDAGDTLVITIQAKVGKAEWKPIGRQTLRIDATKQNSRAFHLGRDVQITITPLKK